MKDSEVLDLAAEVIDQAFCKEAYAIDKNGMRVGVMSPDAVGFCMLGAIARVLGDSVNTSDVVAQKWVAPLLPKRVSPIDSFIIGEFIPPHAAREWPVTPRAWNDLPETKKEQVAAKLREAAVKAREKGE